MLKLSSYFSKGLLFLNDSKKTQVQYSFPILKYFLQKLKKIMAYHIKNKLAVCKKKKKNRQNVVRVTG